MANLAYLDIKCGNVLDLTHLGYFGLDFICQSNGREYSKCSGLKANYACQLALNL